MIITITFTNKSEEIISIRISLIAKKKQNHESKNLKSFPTLIRHNHCLTFDADVDINRTPSIVSNLEVNPTVNFLDIFCETVEL